MNLNLNNSNNPSHPNITNIESFNESSSHLYSWGFGKYGQLSKEFINYSIDPIYSKIVIESPEDEIHQLYSGESHNAILTFNSKLYTYGKNIFGQLGLTTTNYIDTPTLVKFPSPYIKIVKVSLGGEHTLIKTDNSIIFSFGLNIFGQLGTGDNTTRTSPTKITIPHLIDNEDIVDISAGAHHSVLITNKNRIFACGIGKFGLYGNTTSNEDSNVFIPLEHEIFINNCKEGITKVTCGVYHSCVIVNNELEFIIWGLGEVLKYNEPMLIESSSFIGNDESILTQIKDIQIGEDFIIVLTKDDVLYSCGKNNKGQLGLGDCKNRLTFTNIAINDKTQQISIGYEHALAISVNKCIYGWGSNEFGQLALVDDVIFPEPTLLHYLTQLDVVKISSGGYHNIALFNKILLEQETNTFINTNTITEHPIMGNNNVNNNNSGINGEYNLDIFKHNLNIVKLSSTIKKDIPHVINKIKVIDQLKKKLNEYRDKNRQMDTKLKELKEKERAQNILQNSDITQLCRGFDNNFSISLSEIEFDDQIPEIGKGTFGEVRKGIWRGETVAVKFLKTTMLTSRENIECFVQECNVMKNLRHPNIILYMGASIQGPDFFVVTEYCENGNLFEVLHINKSHKLTWKDKHRIALEIALGMNYLHSYEVPILHRDLKSMNVLLDRNDQVKLADFGNTKILANQMTKQKGTFQWMAPEVIRGSDYTEKSDVFSFGIIMNELATRLPPYQGVDKKEVARKVLSHPDYRPQITKRVPKVWIELMTKCYQQRPEDRPTFNKIIQELKRIDPNHLG